jgi:hypothetical protein
MLKLEMQLAVDPKFFKKLPWREQVQTIKKLLDEGTTKEDLVILLNTTIRWVNDVICVANYWTICKHAESLQQAVRTANLGKAQEKRRNMEKLASEAPSITRTILS